MSLILFSDIQNNKKSIINKFIGSGDNKLFKDYCMRIFEYLNKTKLEYEYTLEDYKCTITKIDNIVRKGWVYNSYSVTHIPVYEISLININNDITYYLDTSENNLNELILLNNTLISALNDYATSTPSNSFQATGYLIKDRDSEIGEDKNDIINDCDSVSEMSLEDVEENKYENLEFNNECDNFVGTVHMNSDTDSFLNNTPVYFTSHVINEFNTCNMSTGNWESSARPIHSKMVQYPNCLGYGESKFDLKIHQPISLFIEELNNRIVPNPFGSSNYIDELKDKLKCREY